MAQSPSKLTDVNERLIGATKAAIGMMITRIHKKIHDGIALSKAEEDFLLTGSGRLVQLIALEQEHTEPGRAQSLDDLGVGNATVADIDRIVQTYQRPPQQQLAVEDNGLEGEAPAASAEQIIDPDDLNLNIGQAIGHAEADGPN